MTQTLTKTITTAEQTVATSTGSAQLTLQNKSPYSINMFVDERDKATREAAGDTEPYTLAPHQERIFANFTGSVVAHTDGGVAKLVVVLS